MLVTEVGIIRTGLTYGNVTEVLVTDFGSAESLFRTNPMGANESARQASSNDINLDRKLIRTASPFGSYRLCSGDFG